MRSQHFVRARQSPARRACGRGRECCGSRRPGSRLRSRRPEVFSRSQFCGRVRRGAGADRAERRRQILAAAADRRACCARPAARSTLDGGDPELTLAEQAHYLGHLDALKPALTVRGKPRFWTRLSRRRDRSTPAASRWRRSGSAALADLPAAYLSAGQRRRLSLARLLAVAAPDLAARRADLGARCRRRRRGSPTLMRAHLAGGGMIIAATHGPLGHRRAARAAAGRRAHDRRSPPSSCATCGSRVRVGGGALMGVLFFLIVVTLMPFAVGPDLALLRASARRSCGSARCSRSLLALDRLFAADHEDGSLDLLLMGRAPLELAVARQGAGALAHHRPAAGDRRAAARPVPQSRAARDRRGRADAAGRHAGADLHRPDRRGAVGGAAARRTAAAGAGAAADRSRC